MKGMFRRGGSWYVRIYEGGRDVWRSLGSDYGAACEKLKLIRSKGLIALQGDAGSEHRGLTVAEAVKRWLETYVPTARSEYNQGQSESRCRRYLNKFMGTTQLSRVARDDLRRYRIWLETHPLSPNTVKHLLSDARCFFNWCVDDGLLDYSPVPRRLMPRIQERPPDRLRDDEVERVVAVADPHGFVVRLALGTGARWGELVRMQSTDIQNGEVVIHQTKSGKMRRVPLTAELQRELCGRVGRLVPFASPGQFNSAVKRMSGVQDFHVHRLRHTFACRYLERGGSLAVLQELLGHSTVVMTQRYARVSHEAVRAEFERLEGKRCAAVAGTVAGAVLPIR
jgi:integrase